MVSTGRVGKTQIRAWGALARPKSAHKNAAPNPTCAAASTVSAMGSRYYIFDERGNTVLRLVQNGGVFACGVTDAYGGTVQQVDSIGDDDPYKGFGAQFGYYLDGASQRYLCGLRYYDPFNGSWLTRDPIGQAGGINLYGFCAGNPINNTDPFGTDWEVDWVTVGDVSWGFTGGVIGMFLGGGGGAAGGTLVAPGAGTVAGAGYGAYVGAASGTVAGISINRAIWSWIKGGHSISYSEEKRVPPSRDNTPGLRGTPYHPESVEARIKPQYKTNPAHLPDASGKRAQNPKKSIEPDDAEAVYQKAKRGAHSFDSQRTWYGKGKQGWYRFFDTGDGTTHFSGIIPEKEVPVSIVRGK